MIISKCPVLLSQNLGRQNSMKNRPKTKGSTIVLLTVAMMLYASFMLVFIGYIVSTVSTVTIDSIIEKIIVPSEYSTTNIEDYGVYKGSYPNNNKEIYKAVHSFFPLEIEDIFQNVTYSYKAQQKFNYAFEAYLEFTIENPEEYAGFVEEYTKGIEGQTFLYDSSFTEYVICDDYKLNSLEDAREIEEFFISSADIRKILCCPSEHRIIFVILYSGTGCDIAYFSTYFDRFGIDPFEYAEYWGARPIGYETRQGTVSVKTSLVKE